MTKREVLALQQSLNGSGYAYQLTGEPLVEDGIYGPATEHVHRAWQDQHTRIPTPNALVVVPIPLACVAESLCLCSAILSALC